jgi:adenylate cyclase
MDLPAPLAWLVDEAGASPGPDRFLAELGGRLRPTACRWPAPP